MEDFWPEPVIAGRYKVRQVLGQGGMAEVFAADDLETGETVAVKLLRDPVEATMLDRRLLQELLAGAQVKHPNLVAVVDFGIESRTRRPFFVMEKLEGEDLAHHVAEEGPCDAAWLIPLFCEALDGLDAVHHTGIVHKDIKPANLFVHRAHERVRLRITDFGIAHHMQRSRITEEGGLACTPKYTAPEYLSRSVVTPTSDVYQMGLVLAEALLGWSMVKDGPFTAVAFAHARGELRFPPGLAASPIGRVLQRAMALRPADRYATARDFATALRGLDLGTAAASIELNGALYRRSMLS